ncbi:MAG: GNAT family N-acetyltransferase [Gemmatimonas sp.]
MTELATPRLVLRPVARQDIPRIAVLAGDARVAEMTCFVPHPLSEAQVSDWFDTLARRGERAFAVVRKGETDLIGVVSIKVTERSGEIGYWLGVDHWGQGYMSEAVRRVVRFAVGDLKLPELRAEVFVDNARSVGVLVKAGFEVEGRATRPAPARGGDREVLVFKATRASFARAALSQAVGRE